MNIQFEDNEMQELQDLFNAQDPEEAIFMSHYQLAQATGKSAQAWKEFMLHPAVSNWIKQEIELFKQHQLKQMIRTATDNDRSVGAAQMINSLAKTLDDGTNKTGPIIVYTYVPMTEAQKEGTTIQTIELDQDILAMIPDDWRNEYA
jgi:hypothetical protein